MANDNPFLWWLPSAPETKSAPAAKPRPAAQKPAAPQDASPGLLIRRAQQIAVALFHEECAAYGITPVQHAALTAARQHPGIDATRIAGLIGFDRTTISGVLERLESKGFLSRSARADDRRIKLLTITEAGTALLEAMAPAVEQAQQRILDPLDDDERDHLMSLLAKLVDGNNNASRAPQRPLSDPA